MITIFNRRELCVTSSMKEQAQIRRLLSGEGVCYRIVITQRGGRGFGENPDFSNIYHFFVSRKDYDRAKQILEDTPGA